jgi:hypothetical protein
MFFRRPTQCCQELQPGYAGAFLPCGESQASLNGYCSWALGHATLEDQVIAYSSLIIRPMPKLNLFETGKNLRVIESAVTTKPNTSSASITYRPEVQQTDANMVIDAHNSTNCGA